MMFKHRLQLISCVDQYFSQSLLDVSRLPVQFLPLVSDWTVRGPTRTLLAGRLLGLHNYPEDGGSMFSPYVGEILSDCMTSYPEDSSPHRLSMFI
jgi:hypothetical protein